ELNVPEYTFLTSLILSECHNNKRENDFDNEKKQNDNHVNHEISNSATNESASKILGNDHSSRIPLLINRIPHLCEIALDNVNNRILDICNRAANLLKHFVLLMFSFSRCCSVEQRTLIIPWPTHDYNESQRITSNVCHFILSL